MSKSKFKVIRLIDEIEELLKYNNYKVICSKCNNMFIKNTNSIVIQEFENIVKSCKIHNNLNILKSIRNIRDNINYRPSIGLNII